MNPKIMILAISLAFYSFNTQAQKPEVISIIKKNGETINLKLFLLKYKSTGAFAMIGVVTSQGFQRMKKSKP
jgi:hypothetical protein